MNALRFVMNNSEGTNCFKPRGSLVIVSVGLLTNSVTEGGSHQPQAPIRQLIQTYNYNNAAVHVHCRGFVTFCKHCCTAHWPPAHSSYERTTEQFHCQRRHLTNHGRRQRTCNDIK